MNDHSSTCCCICCLIANASEPSTPESDRESQKIMIERWGSIASVLSDEAGPTNHDRDSRAEYGAAE